MGIRKQTSDKWKKQLCPDLIIMDYDGWDRNDLFNSFSVEEITEDEFNKRLAASTIMDVNERKWKD